MHCLGNGRKDRPVCDPYRSRSCGLSVALSGNLVDLLLVEFADVEAMEGKTCAIDLHQIATCQEKEETSQSSEMESRV